MRIPSLLALLALFPAAAAAQSVRGSVVERGSGTPVPGALVALVGEDGAVRAEVLTDAEGRFLVRAASAGRYTLRADRVGYRSATSAALELAAGATVEHTLQAAGERVVLPGVTAAATRRCATRQDPGAEVVGLWTEARKVLRSTAYAAIQFPLRYRVARTVRQLDPASGTVVAEEAQTAEALKPTPFVTVPPERLAEKGYVEARADTVLFHGPDAEVLLSDAFLDAHCFQARAGGRGNPGQVGLAFAPAGERAIAGLRGVLWLDAATAELRTLEYEYVWRELPRASEAGGRVEFRRLPTGAWIVSRWRIRMPSGALRFRALGVTSPGLFPRVARVTEESGEVLEVRTAEGAEVSMTARAGVAGVVWDSTRARPLAGARVYLAGTGREARSDSAGRFALEGVPEGAYSLAFEHPRLDSLRFTPEPVRVVAVPPRTSRADLALPPLGAVLTAACPARADAGALGGQVREAGTGRLLARVPVRASWLRPGESGDTARALAVSDDAGAYRFCALPAGVPVRVAAALPGAAEAEVRLEPGRPAVHALEIPGRGETAGDALPGRVALRVVDEATSRPLAGVTVRFGGAIPDAVSDRRGMVRLADVPAGSYGVELRHDTYGAGTARVAVRGGLPTELEIRLPRRAVTLEPLVVQARRVAPGALDAGRGRRMNMVTRDEIDQRPAARNVGELVARFPGLRLRYDDRGDICLESMREVATRLSSLGVCNGLQLFLDDLPVGQGMEFATSIPMNTVESVVVLNPTEAFGLYGFMAHRGALLVYTRGNGPTMRRRR